MSLHGKGGLEDENREEYVEDDLRGRAGDASEDGPRGTDVHVPRPESNHNTNDHKDDRVGEAKLKVPQKSTNHRTHCDHKEQRQVELEVVHVKLRTDSLCKQQQQQQQQQQHFIRLSLVKLTWPLFESTRGVNFLILITIRQSMVSSILIPAELSSEPNLVGNVFRLLRVLDFFRLGPLDGAEEETKCDECHEKCNRQPPPAHLMYT